MCGGILQSQPIAMGVWKERTQPGVALPETCQFQAVLTIFMFFFPTARFFQTFSEFQVLHFYSLCLVHFTTCHIWVIYITRTALLQSFHCLTFLFLGKAHAGVLSFPRLLEEMAWSVHKLIKIFLSMQEVKT